MRFVKNDKFSGLEFHYISSIHFIRAIYKYLTTHLKMEIRLIYTKEDVCRGTENKL